MISAITRPCNVLWSYTTIQNFTHCKWNDSNISIDYAKHYGTDFVFLSMCCLGSGVVKYV